MYSKRIKQRRQEIDIGQADLAKMTGISQSMISAYENGKNSPTAEVLTILSKVLDVSVDWLLGKTDDQLEDVKLSDDE
jgi:transcriptional regulator with XRE-family HTH domain